MKLSGDVSMGVVEVMQQKKAAFVGGSIALMVLAAVSMAYQLWPQKHYSQTMTYFSDDDGKTWFLDGQDNVPPYDHEGKQAYRANIYSYDHGSKQFCGYLIRYSPTVQKALAAAITAGAKKTPPDSPQTIMNSQDFASSFEVKKPMSNDPWYGIGNPKSQPTMRVQSPDGSVLDSVLP